jgi:hypothetical protein
LSQIVYVSRPFGYDAAMLTGILVDARLCNRRDGLTGSLICRADLYCQLIEGPEQMVNACFARICRDDRHLEVRKLASVPITERLFAGWDMRHDPVRSWMWSSEDVARGALEAATEDEVLGIFRRLADEAGPPPA